MAPRDSEALRRVATISREFGDLLTGTIFRLPLRTAEQVVQHFPIHARLHSRQHTLMRKLINNADHMS